MITQAKWLAWLLLLMMHVTVYGADFVARLDRPQVGEGDPVVLTLSASGGASGAPELTPLQQDFDLLNRSQSTHMRFVNGRSFSGTEWHLTLMPKRTGTIEIPAIQFGNLASKPLTLEVLPAAQAAKQGMPRPVMIEVDAEPRQPYVQQKVIYTVRVLFATPPREVKLSEPGVSGALVRALGEGRRYESYRNGRQYQVFERQYAIQPQHSGALEITGPTVTARIPQPGQQQRGGSLRDRLFGNDPFSALGRDPFAGMNNLLGQTRPVQARGQTLSIDVQPQPPGTSTPWLPAESLTLNETWSPEPTEFRVGEPITRTVVITAQGLSGEQLPDLAFDMPAGVKAYPEKPKVQTRPDQDSLVAQKVIRAALIPNRAGELTLPEIRVAWWDVNAGNEVVASLPARQIDVQPGATGATSVPEPAASGSAANRQALQSPETSPLPVAREVGNASDRGTAGTGWPYWPWLTGLLGVALLVALAALWRRGRTRPPTASTTDTYATAPHAAPRPDPTRALVMVEHAFHANDAKAARRALLAWAEQRWPDDPPRRLDVIAERLGPQAVEIVQGLDSALYADSAEVSAWNGRDAWQALKVLMTAAGTHDRKHVNDETLPPLYVGSR